MSTSTICTLSPGIPLGAPCVLPPGKPSSAFLNNSVRPSFTPFYLPPQHRFALSPLPQGQGTFLPTEASRLSRPQFGVLDGDQQGQMLGEDEEVEGDVVGRYYLARVGNRVGCCF